MQAEAGGRETSEERLAHPAQGVGLGFLDRKDGFLSRNL